MTRGGALCVAALAMLLVVAINPIARAQTGVVAERRARTFGAGFAVGVGPQVASHYAAGVPGSPSALAYSIGSLELMAFVDQGFSIDVSVQLASTLVDLAYGAYAWTSTVYFDWSFGSDVRLVVGPGLGFSAYGRPSDPSSAAGAELHVAALLGLETLSSDDRFGFRVVTRPWLALGGGEQGFDVGYGAMLEIGFLFYAL